MSLHLYLGAPRCGKSTLLRRHVYSSRQPVLAFLIMDRDGKSSWDGPTFASVDELRRRDTIPRFCLFRRDARAVAQLAIELGHCVYVDEEAHKVALEGYGPARPPRRAGELERPAHPLYLIAHEGAHLENARGEPCEVAALLATHRPANLPADLVACADGVYLGRTLLYADVERCYREGWVRDATSPADARRILGTLGVGEFLHTSNR